MTLATIRPPTVTYGQASPRIAPPLPLAADTAALLEMWQVLGVVPMPWQAVATQYIAAMTGDRHTYREVCLVASRQNGKTEMLVALIIARLMAGRKIMHTAQNRVLPREVFDRVADWASNDMTLFRQRFGKPLKPRYANGQEEVVLANGGRYKIVAPTGGGARGGTNDDVIVDELREFETNEFIGAAKPTMTASRDPQIIYLSNAGDDSSVVLNAIRARAGQDPNLAYLEWSSGPDRAVDDRDGWLEANPAIGHIPTMLDYLEGEYTSNRLAGTLAIFETEHLCRWVTSMRQRLVNETAWASLRADLEPVRRPWMGVSMDPSGRRASAVIAWPQSNGSVALQVIAEVHGDPIDVDLLGPDLRKQAAKLGVQQVAFDPWTDGDLARHFAKKAKPLMGRDFAVASENFSRRVADQSIAWDGAEQIAADLAWTDRKSHESGAYTAVKANDDHPITAALAAIRAVWLASAPRPSGSPKVY